MPAGVDGGVDAAPPSDAGAPDAQEPAVEPDLACPGATGCETSDDVQLQAGAASVEITPDMEVAETFTDLNGNATWDALDEPFDDRNGDGVFQGEWIAGFGNGRAADGVHDPLWARAVALRTGNTTVALVVLDTVGYFIDEMDEIRADLSDEGLDLDHLAVAATHTHQGRDTVGIWGASIGDSGLSPAFMQRTRERVAQAVREALRALRPANIEYAAFRLGEVDPDGDTNRYIGDNRHPNIVDDEVRVLRLIEAGTGTADSPGSGTTIATLVNLAGHPEYLGSENRRLSSDYPFWLRQTVEVGLDAGPDGAPVPGLGGVCIFVNGAVGAQIGPNHIHPRLWDGTEVVGRSLQGGQTVGTQVGHYVLEALRGAGATTEETASIGFRTVRFRVVVENTRYHIAGQQHLFDRGLYDYDDTRPINRLNLPSVETAVTVLDIGAATMLTAPGELDPAEFVGGYEAPCPYTPGGCENLLFGGENLPDLSRAPEGPFLRERLASRRPEAAQVWLLGLTDDYLGYFLPEFDYELAGGLPYIAEAPGQHYEETNSVGAQGWPRIRRKMQELIEWRPR